jgi:hypothetical protein
MCGRWTLCNQEAAKWWGTAGVEEINITLSARAHAGAYKCRMLDGFSFEIQSELNGKWYSYSIYTPLRKKINCLPSQKTFYMGIEAIE